MWTGGGMPVRLGRGLSCLLALRVEDELAFCCQDVSSAANESELLHLFEDGVSALHVTTRFNDSILVAVFLNECQPKAEGLLPVRVALDGLRHCLCGLLAQVFTSWCPVVVVYHRK